MKIRQLLENSQFRGYAYDASHEDLNSPKFHCDNLNLINDNNKDYCTYDEHGLKFTGGFYDVTQLLKPTLKETWVPILNINLTSTIIVHSNIVSFKGFPYIIDGCLKIQNKEISSLEGMSDIDFVNELSIPFCQNLTNLTNLPYFRSLSINMISLKNNLYKIFLKGNSTSTITIGTIFSKCSPSIVSKLNDIINDHFEMLDKETNKRVYLRLQQKLIEEELDQYCET